MNLFNCFATSICKNVIQVVISTGRLRFCAQVSISLLTQVHNSYPYLSKSSTNIFKELTNVTNKNRKTRTSLHVIILQFLKYWKTQFTIFINEKNSCTVLSVSNANNSIYATLHYQRHIAT